MWYDLVRCYGKTPSTFYFLICNFSFLAVTCNDYRCSFIKIYTWLFFFVFFFFFAEYPHLPEENSCLNYLEHLQGCWHYLWISTGHSLPAVGMEIHHTHCQWNMTVVHNTEDLIAVVTCFWLESDRLLCYIQLGIHLDKTTWTPKCI